MWESDHTEQDHEAQGKVVPNTIDSFINLLLPLPLPLLPSPSLFGSVSGQATRGLFPAQPLVGQVNSHMRTQSALTSLPVSIDPTDNDRPVEPLAEGSFQQFNSLPSHYHIPFSLTLSLSLHLFHFPSPSRSFTFSP